MASAALDIADLEVSYGATPVLHRLSLGVAAGEFVALLGPSGCGKTTLLRAVSGFVPVNAGRIAVGGRDITHAPPDKRGMAMVFQSYALWPHMTTAQNLGYGLKLRRVSRPQIGRRVAEILAMLKLEGYGERNVTQLSGGQRQRVALGRALAISPELLLLDEPLSNLDARIREEVRHEIKALQAKLGITTIHVTHDREEAMVMADRIAILDAGRIAQLGSPEEVYNRPVSPFVAAFMGAGNVLELEARSAGNGIEIQAGAHNDSVRVPECALAGPVVAHFRSEAARLGPADATVPDQLLLRGRIVQASYPGGFYRYAVAVGQNQFMVDDTRRLAVGETVGIGLPVSSLHFFSRREA
jgi:ABC-type Fe3+/spermidine/putrescine transport system ATPase subunit